VATCGRPTNGTVARARRRLRPRWAEASGETGGRLINGSRAATSRRLCPLFRKRAGRGWTGYLPAE
jgi:hypothetical protein